MAVDNTRNITLDQGSSYTYQWTLIDQGGDPFDATGFDARLQVRRTFGDTSTLINCTLANNKVAIDSNVITMTLGPGDTSSIRFNDKEDSTLECVYDLEIQSLTGKVYKPAKGSMTLNREVTR